MLDVWYQKAEYGDVWIPYLHVCMTQGELADQDTGSRVKSAFDVNRELSSFKI